jgi:Ca2+-binding EF-hand superfamily protein
MTTAELQNEEDAIHAREQKIFAAFDKYDVEKFGYISVTDLQDALEACGEILTEDEVYLTISYQDPTNTGDINLAQFKEILNARREDAAGSSEEELLEAFVAMGGEPDGDGAINADKLIYTIKEEFQMTIDIEKLIEEIDEDGSGQIEFDEFTALLSGAKPEDEDEED